MTILLSLVIGMAVGVGIYLFVLFTRRQAVGPKVLTAGAAVCLALFIVVNVSDWPGGFLADYWQRHPIVGATAGTLLLVGIGYLAFEVQDRRHQEAVDSRIVATGRSGLVDHLIDIDVSLSLCAGSYDQLVQLWPTWDAPNRPLRWLRQNRERLDVEDGVFAPDDPRGWNLPDRLPNEAWRADLLQQAVRRIMSGIKEWSPILARSRAGQDDLLKLGDLRREILLIEQEMVRGQESQSLQRIRKAQNECRDLGYAFETGSGAIVRSTLIDPATGTRTGQEETT